MQKRPCDVDPNNPQDKYSIALQDEKGWFGFDIPLQNIRPSTQNNSAPLQRIGFNSYHAGRGFDKFVPDQYGYYDARNMWRTTPGKAHATLLMRWGRGFRDCDWNMPNANGVTWKQLVGATRYLDVSFTASASYTATKLILLIRKRVPAGTVGAPGTITVEICSNSAGNPNTVLETATLTASDLTDVTSEYYVWTISEALTSGTTYHLKVYGASADSKDACWEIGCDNGTSGLRSSAGSSWTSTTYSPYYRITDADKARTFKYFTFDNALYAVSIYDNGSTSSELYMNGIRGQATGTQSSTTLKDTGYGTYAAALTTDRFVNCYIRIIRGTGAGQIRKITANTTDTFTVTPAWTTTPVTADSEYVVYGSEWWVQIGSTSLGVVTGKPVVQNGIVYFPQGDGSDITRVMRLDYTDSDDHGFADDGASDKSTFFASGFDPSIGPLIWRANNAATTGGSYNAKKVSVSYAPTSPGGTPLTWIPSLQMQNITLAGDNTNKITNIFFDGSTFYIGKENALYILQGGQIVKMPIGVETAPDINNFIAMITGANRQLYASYLNDVYLISSGGSYPTGIQNNLPSARSGYVADMEARKNWIFAVIDAGDGTSSVMLYSLNEQSWSEHLRGFFTGRRMRAISWQDNPGTRPRLWVEIGGEMVFQEFPINGVRPYDDSGMKYQHEFELVLPTIDLQSTDPKYFARLTVTSQGLATPDDTEIGNEIIVEWQADNDIGTSNWTHAGYIRNSPSGCVDISKGNKRMLRPRLRCVSSQASDPVIVETINMTLFSRGQLSHQWTMYFQLDGSDEEQTSKEVLNWLVKQAKEPYPLKMKSRFSLFDNRIVTLADEPSYVIEELNPDDGELEAQIQMILVEVT